MSTLNLPRRMLVALGIVGSLAVGAASASAGLTSLGYVNTLNTLHADWGWNPEEADAFPLTGPTPLAWSGAFTITGDAAVGWTIELNFQHMVAPHPSDVAPGNPYSATWSFADIDYGMIIQASGALQHPASHSDVYSFSFDRSADPANTIITLDVYHAPDAGGSLALLGCAMAVVAPLATRRSRRG